MLVSILVLATRASYRFRLHRNDIEETALPSPDFLEMLEYKG